MRCFWLFLALLLLASNARAATYVVEDDRTLIAAARGIIVGTVLDTHARRAPNGLIETVSTIAIDEAIKGLTDVGTLEVVHAGGRLGAKWMLQAGAPRYGPGERLLLLLDRDRHGHWTTHGLALGSFRFERDASGSAVLSRGEIAGWNADGTTHIERPRPAQAFLDEVRGFSRDATENVSSEAQRLAPHAAFTGASYTLRFDGDSVTPIRRFGGELSVSWRVSGTQGGLDFAQAIDFGTAKWNAQSPSIDFSRSATPASDDTVGEDAESRIIAGDPHDEISGSCCGGIIASAWIFGTTESAATFNGETFHRVSHSDIIVNDGVSLATLGQARFNTTMAHELGHTLGLRHADANAGEGPCQAPLECCGSGCKAIMRAAIGVAHTSLQTWDRNAVDCLYDGVCKEVAACTPPSITMQPVDQTIVPGSVAELTVEATGTAPLSYRWYIGNAGEPSEPAGSTSATLGNLAPAVTTSYWVRVTGPCSPAANSRTATVSVCTPPSILGPPAETLIRAGARVTLSVAAGGSTPQTYTWFEGSVGDVSRPVGTNASEFTSVPLFRETSFWVRVTNACGSVDSTASRVRIQPGKRRAVR